MNTIVALFALIHFWRLERAANFLLFPAVTTNAARTPTAVTCCCIFGHLWRVFALLF